MASTVKIVWNPQFKEGLMGELTRRMRTAGSQAVTSIQSKLSTRYPPAAALGQPPHLRTGALRAGMTGNVTRTGPTKVELVIGARAPRYAVPVLARHPVNTTKIVVGAVKRALKAR